MVRSSLLHLRSQAKKEGNRCIIDVSIFPPREKSLGTPGLKQKHLFNLCFQQTRLEPSGEELETTFHPIHPHLTPSSEMF